MKMKRLFLATPIEGRKEVTYEERLKGAKKRIEDYFLTKPRRTDWERVNIFEVYPDFETMHPHEFMKNSIELLKTCDVLVLDYGSIDSAECLEWYKIAKINNIKVWELMGEVMEKVVSHFIINGII